MTTIIYDHERGLICADGRICAGNEILTETQVKCKTRGDWVLFISGALADQERILGIVELPHGAKGVDEGFDKIEACGIAVNKKESKVYRINVGEEGYLHKWEVTWSECIGSGGVYAKTFLDLNPEKDIQEAVNYAGTRDTGTGKAYVLYSLADNCYETLF